MFKDLHDYDSFKKYNKWVFMNLIDESLKLKPIVDLHYNVEMVKEIVPLLLGYIHRRHFVHSTD